MGALVVGLFCFFSSRRRHTRYIGDWSSDVCSSDLDDKLGCERSVAHGSTGHTRDPGGIALSLRISITGLFVAFLAVAATSSILDMTPPIGGLALASLRDTFGEVHNGHLH